jgi:ubiquinone biosynthesis protein UbiJ
MVRLAVINHLLGQRADLRGELMRHAGRDIAIRVPPFTLRARIAEDGYWQDAAAGAPDATLTIPPAVLPRLALRDPSATQAVVLEGESTLAHDVARVLQALDWDAEHDLARLIGDAPAHRLAETARSLIGDPRDAARRLADAAVEYLQEEAKLLVARPTAERFMADVDRLRDDVARLEARLRRLEG